VNDVTGFEIHDFEAVVFNSHEKSVTLSIYAQIINAPLTFGSGMRDSSVRTFDA
jgi:hypothetical protein